MNPYYQDDQVTLYHGDCLDVMTALPDESVAAVVCDPPYDLTTGKRGGSGAASINLESPYGRSRIGTGNGVGGFMGKAWDSTGVAFEPETWAHCLRLLKPGGYLISFGGTRTFHRLACAIEDAGFEIRDSIAWLFGSGFPKSLNLPGGLGTALKPAHEPIVVARKPLRGTVAANVAEHGTGALNIDATRIAHGADVDLTQKQRQQQGEDNGWRRAKNMVGTDVPMYKPAGRWPTNVVIDEHTAAGIDEQSGITKSPPVGSVTKTKPRHSGSMAGAFNHDPAGMANGHGDSGGASRFFPTFRYEAKAPGTERPTADGIAHPTVKPLDLMRWLVRLVTPPHGLVLDPFAGSGTTAEACIHEHMRCITIEREPDYLPLIVGRLSKPMAIGFDFGEAS